MTIVFSYCYGNAKESLERVAVHQAAHKQNLIPENLSGSAVPRRPRRSTAASMIGSRPGG